MTEFDYTDRQQRARGAIASKKLDALVVTHLPNVLYLCGFTGSNAVLVVGGRKPVLFTDGRYSEQARTEAATARVVIAKESAIVAAARYLERSGWKNVGIEADHLSVASRSGFAQELPKSVRLRETRGVVEALRMVKDAAELERIRRAVIMGAMLLPRALEAIRPGVPETHVAAEIEYAARRGGAEAMSFDTIVASGPRSALPHGRASAAPIARNGFVVLDFGVILASYCSDMTRTVYVGRASRQTRVMYDAVLAAQLAGIEAVKPGATTGDVDRAARRVLQQAGLAKFFTHSTGHGVGLEIHEAPRLARDGTDVLWPGMVVTIEPGAYVAGTGGVRIEDMVAVTETGHEVLTPAEKDLIEI